MLALVRLPVRRTAYQASVEHGIPVAASTPYRYSSNGKQPK
jgi:hypothetical protein